MIPVPTRSSGHVWSAGVSALLAVVVAAVTAARPSVLGEREEGTTVACAACGIKNGPLQAGVGVDTAVVQIG
jgi:hypothetical protein